MEGEEKNIIRSDKRVGSVFSILIFILVFTFGYLFYPQISMFLPFLGENVTKQTSYRLMGITEMLDCPVILTARAEEIGKAQASVGGSGADVSASVTLTVLQTLKGQSEQTITVTQLGGSALINNKKYNVRYPDAAQFEKGETYLLFLSGEIVYNGRFGAMKQNSDGTFTDGAGWTYSLTEIRQMLPRE